MINLDFTKNKTFYVVGLGKSNKAAVKALTKAGADVRVWDDKSENLLGTDDKIVCHPDKAPWSKIKAVVMAPGIPPTHPIVVTALDKDVSVICDIDLYAQSNPTCKIIAITGTNGKSTTTALIHHILNYKGKSQMGGNIGDPVLSMKNRVDYSVLELSSYQLDRAPNLQSDVAILLNITPDHLEWHGEMDNYIAAKAKIFNGATHKIINIDDDISKSIADAHDDANRLSIYDELPFNQSNFPKMKGAHNLQNLCAAYQACEALGIDHDIIIDRMKSFDGLAHRQYLVRVINGVPYVNDSKATNAEATKQALRAYKNIILIAGGAPKDGGLDGIDNDLAEVKKAYLFGAAKADFAEFLTARGIDVETGETLDDVLPNAHRYAQELRGEPSGAPTVLFSPACASFDQYNNFEQRGDHFVELVNGLDDD